MKKIYFEIVMVSSFLSIMGCSDFSQTHEKSSDKNFSNRSASSESAATSDSPDNDLSASASVEDIKSNEVKTIIDNIVLESIFTLQSEDWKRLFSMKEAERRDWLSHLILASLSHNSVLKLSNQEIDKQKYRIFSAIIPIIMDDKQLQYFSEIKVANFKERLASYCTWVNLFEVNASLSERENEIVSQVKKYLDENFFVNQSSLDEKIKQIDGGFDPNLEAAIDREAVDVLLRRYDEQGMIQEKIWLLSRLGKSSEALILQNSLETILKTAEIKSVDELGKGGASNPLLVTLTGEIQAVFKPYANRGFMEVAAFNFDKLLALGVVPTTVERAVNGELGSFQYYIRDAKDGEEYSMHYLWLVKEITDRFTPEKDRKLNFLDFILINSDINEKGFLIRKNRQQVAIDYNCAFVLSEGAIKFQDVSGNSKAFYPGNVSFKKLKALKDSDFSEIFKIGQVNSDNSEEILRRVKDFVRLIENSRDL